MTLNRAAAHAVSVDYATEDGTAAAGADYTATTGTLVFAGGRDGEDGLGTGARRRHRRGQGDDAPEALEPAGGVSQERPQAGEGASSATPTPSRRAYLGHFGRRAASDAIAAVTERFETPRGAGSHLTFAGQRLDVSGAGLGQTVTGLARAFGAEEVTAGDDPWNDPASAPGRAMSERELLMGTSFRAVLDQGDGRTAHELGPGGVGVALLGGCVRSELERRGRDRCARHGLRAGPVARRVRAHAQPRRGDRARCGRDLRAGEAR